MSAPRLTDSQASALALLARRPNDWVGALEGVEGSTLTALDRRGLALVRWVDRPHYRLVGRVTIAGIAEAMRRARRYAASELELTHAELDVLEGIVRTAPAGSVDVALATIEKLRPVACT